MQSSLSSAKGKGSSSPHDGCFKCGGAHFQRDCNARNGTGKQHMAKANKASHGPRVSRHTQAKVRARKTRANPKEHPKEPEVRTKVPKAYTRAKQRKLVSQVLKTRNCGQARKLRNLFRLVPWTLLGMVIGSVTNGTVAGVSMSGMTIGVLLDGTKEKEGITSRSW